MVGWGKWAPGELALWFIIITRSVQIPSNYLSYIYLLHKLLVHFFILFFYSTTGLVAGLWDVLWDFLPLILIFLLKFGLKLQYLHFTHIILLLLTQGSWKSFSSACCSLFLWTRQSSWIAARSMPSPTPRSSALLVEKDTTSSTGFASPASPLLLPNAYPKQRSQALLLQPRDPQHKKSSHPILAAPGAPFCKTASK